MDNSLASSGYTCQDATRSDNALHVSSRMGTQYHALARMQIENSFNLLELKPLRFHAVRVETSGTENHPSQANPVGNTAQQRAIEARGNVLVAAGAGTGKTSTLVRRCLRVLLEDDPPSSLENILMVTFTEAAAAEMRARIRQALQQRLEATPLGTEPAGVLEEQLALLGTAQISTLHGFCLELVRQHFHGLEIDPQVMVLDETQTKPMMGQTLDELLEECYDAPLEGPEHHKLGPAVRELVRRYGRGSDERIRSLVLRLHRYAQSRADAEGWLERQTAVFREVEPIRWREWLLAGFEEWRAQWRPVVQSFASQAENVSQCSPALLTPASSLEEVGAALERIHRADEQDWKRGTKGTVRKSLKEFFDDTEFLRSLVHSAPSAPGQTNEAASTDGCALSSDPLAQDWEWVRHPMLALLELAQEFTIRFTKRKRDLGGVDFADQEQMALRLLSQPEIREHWRRQFHHIFVDEYQDINAAQDAIIHALSREGPEANLFLVGDVKQSIYRFRLADPMIFRNYEEQWGSGSATGERIPLSENYRSRHSILAFVNPLFATLMRPSLGSVAYDEDACLRFGAGPKLAGLGITGDAEPRVELHLVAVGTRTQEGGDMPDSDESGESLEDLDSTRREARLIASRLRQMRESGQLIWDGKELRAVEWSDMAVLLQSVRGRVEGYAQEFHAQGVPLQAPRGGFYDALEIRDLLNLCHLLDNPIQDLPLLGVLRSPLVGLSPDDLVAIRVCSRDQGFWDALRKFQREGMGTQKVNEFLHRYERWRGMLRHSSLSQCLEMVLTDTQYETLLLTEDRGSERVANVHKLLDVVREYDPAQHQGLFRFLQFVKSQAKAELEEEPAPVQTTNAVRVLTIHKSKGLEFPVVVVAGLGSVFNEQDLREDILLDEKYGICPKVLSPQSEQPYPSLPYWLARHRQRRELLAEKLRLLYVAMTRARDTLVLVASPRGKQAGEKWPALAGQAPAITDREVSSARCLFDWLKLWLPTITHDTDWTSDQAGQNSLLRWRIWSAGALAAPSDVGLLPSAPTPSNPSAPSDTIPPISELAAAVRQRMEWQYPCPAATIEPAKTSVSALRKRMVEEDAQEARFLFQSKVPGPRLGASGNAGRLSASAVGTIHHTFLEWVSLDRTGSLVELKNEAERMREAGVLSREEIAALNFEALLSFWMSELGRRIRARPNYVQREMPFTARFAPTSLAQLHLSAPAESLAGEFVVIQGYIDLAVVQPDQIWLLDFKTDEVTDQSLAEKMEKYASQLNLYGLALEQIFSRPVTQKWLYFLALHRSVRLSEKDGDATLNQP